MSRLFADTPLKTSKLPAFRAEHFPYSGPYPWLDHPDATARIEARTDLTAEEKERCRYWSEHGYLILNNLIDEPTLDAVWRSYERAIASGRMGLPREAAAEDDPHPGHFLNPHRKPGPFAAS